MRFLQSWLGLSVSLLTGFTVGAGQLSLIGTHPTSPLTSFPAVFSLQAYEGRIYIGYGDWGFSPVAVIVSYDPTLNAFCLEYSAPTDALDNYQSVGGRLYAPSIDPIHYEGFRDYSVREKGRWRSFTPGGFLHVFDFDTLNGTDLWTVGSKLPNETPTTGGVVMRSVDGGRSWQDVTSVAAPGPYYYGFVLRGRFYVRDRHFDGTNVTTFPQAAEFLYRPTVLNSGTTNEFVVGLAGRAPGANPFRAENLVTFDGSSWRTIHPSILSFTVSKDIVYALAGTQILRSTFLSASQAVWEALPIVVVTNASSIEVQNEIVYIGDSLGQLWAGNLDGSPLSTSTPAVVNEMSDAFGSAMALEGDLLAVGAPDHSGALYLCGQVTTWERVGSNWVQRAVIDPPQPSLSGWFGRDVAMSGNVMAVLESGKDASSMNRGSSARVHLYERTTGGWEWRRSITNAFTHSIALEGTRLAVASDSGLSLFTLTNGNPATTGLERNFLHTAPGYQPIGRATLDGDTLAYGLAGDISRAGGPGQVNVYERSPTGFWSQVATLRQDTPPLPAGVLQHPDYFGFSISLKDGWLAVGAPRNDVAAPQAGAVHLYERSVSSTGVVYVLRQTLLSPIGEPEARFGAAVSMAGSRLLVGAPGIAGVNPQQGRVYAYQRQGPSWVSLGELYGPSNDDGEFGWKVLAATNLCIASGRSGLSSNLEDRISMTRTPEVLLETDLAAGYTASTSTLTNGASIRHFISLTNLGPSTATRVRLTFRVAGPFEVDTVAGPGLACTNLGTEVRCEVGDLPAGEVRSLQIDGTVQITGACSEVRGEVVVAAQEFDTDGSNNRIQRFINSEPPTIALMSPTNGTLVPYAGSVLLNGATSGPTSIASVAFYSNGLLLRSLLTPPYVYLWTNAPSGTHRITARVFDTCGVSRDSEAVTITVATNIPPQITLLSPVPGTRFSAPATVPMYVAAKDPDGTVTRVELHRTTGPLKLFQATPYWFDWSNAPAGSHAVYAIARDNHGAVSTSTLVRITVGTAASSGTNWAAYNDHSQGSGTRNTVTRYDILGATPGSFGILRNVSNAAVLPVTLAITRSATSLSPSAGLAPNPGTPAANIFGGQVDFATGQAANVGIGADAWVRYSFAGLDPNLRYTFKGTAVRGLPDYTNRWTRVELTGARAVEPAHTAGCLTGVGGMTQSQVAFNAGYNLTGDVVIWTNIQPALDGIIAVTCSQYRGPVPGGSSGGENAFALTAVTLEEMAVPVSPSPSFVLQPMSLTVSPGATASFSVTVTGEGPLSYQWLRNRTAVPGATSESLTLNVVTTNDAGTYGVIVSGAMGGAVSETVVLTLLSLELEPQFDGYRARLKITGPVGQRYGVQHLNALEPLPAWNILTNLTLSTNQAGVTDPDSHLQPSRYYRVLPLP